MAEVCGRIAKIVAPRPITEICSIVLRNRFQMLLNLFDATYRRFEKNVLPARA
jgi:hypothetical protein